MACDCGNNGKRDTGLVRQTKPVASNVSSEANPEEKKELENKELINKEALLPKRIIKFM